MKHQLLILLIFGAFLALSCEKEQIPVVENVGLPLIVKEIYSDDLFNEFTYNEQNLLVARKSKFFYTQYHYKINGQVVSYDLYEDSRVYSSNWQTAQEAFNRTDWVSPENTTISAKAYYSYENDQIGAITVFHIPFEMANKSSFQYDDQGRIMSQVIYDSGEVTGRIEYSYDETGNVTKEEQYSSGILFATRLYEYDNKHNPFNVFRQLLIPGIYTNRNNIIKETHIMADNGNPGMDTVQVNESVYEYNEQGYPVTKNGVIRYEYK